MSFARLSTDDTSGKMRGLRWPRTVSEDPFNILGGGGSGQNRKMRMLRRNICENSFKHHIAANLSADASTVAMAVHEAKTQYLGSDMYWYGRDNGAC
jgi:L-fucose isomerase-like protein